jgi:hypothetical protein
VDLQCAVVVDKTWFPQLIHEKVGAAASAKILKATKARRAKFRAEKSKKGKT